MDDMDAVSLDPESSAPHAPPGREAQGMDEVEMEAVDLDGGDGGGGAGDDHGEDAARGGEEAGDHLAAYAELHERDGGAEDGVDRARSPSAAAAARAQDGGGGERGDDDDDDGARDETGAVPIFKDGKGQPRSTSGGASAGSKRLSLSLGRVDGTAGDGTDGGEAARRRRAAAKLDAVTPRDRLVRLAAHKWHVLALIAHARIRNAWLNDEALRNACFDVVPSHLLLKLKQIHPKRVSNQRERVRMFEALLHELVQWWALRHFRLEPNVAAAVALRQPRVEMVGSALGVAGRRVDGWVIESGAQREERWARERKERLKRLEDGKKAQHRPGEAPSSSSSVSRARSSKGKARAEPADDDDAAEGAAPSSSSTTGKSAPRLATDITLFAPGKAIRPVYLRLAPNLEPIREPTDLVSSLSTRKGSREASAQLFCCLCRSLGIPARLVVSLQVAPWSVSASKVASTTGALEPREVKRVAAGRRNARAKARADADARAAAAADRGGEVTDSASDDEDEGGGGGSAVAPAADGRPVPATQPTSSSTPGRRNGAPRAPPKPQRNGRTPTQRRRAAAQREAESSGLSDVDVIEARLAKPEPKSKARAKGARAKAKENGQQKGKEGDEEEQDDDGDYRDAKWKGLKTPLQVEHRPKLRAVKPKPAKPTELEADELSDVEPLDRESPPTVWVEVFSKPWQRWITVDPVRAKVEPLGNRGMEPSPSDRSNRLVYVLAFEEDGYARDVTARYTRTLHSRVSRMRAPSGRRGRAAEGGGEWWSSVVRAVHRPQRLERDAAEDAELEEAAGREPMPNSVAAFKDHPVYALERHLRRDEVIHPPNQAGTFQGIPVFLRANVVACRSARNWFNEGRVVREGETALKFVKARGYTLANKRAEEQARLEGQEAPQEGLYAHFQTQLYVAPPVVDGEVPRNAFGNIDLFVESMLPAGGAHVPYNGAAKVAKKLGISYAEAITGFEFKKHRSMPKITGIVVPAEHEEAVLEAYWASEHAAAEREMSRRQQRALKNWKKLLNALRIARRVQAQYGTGNDDEVPGNAGRKGRSTSASAAATAAGDGPRRPGKRRGGEREEEEGGGEDEDEEGGGEDEDEEEVLGDSEDGDAPAGGFFADDADEAATRRKKRRRVKEGEGEVDDDAVERARAAQPDSERAGTGEGGALRGADRLRRLADDEAAARKSSSSNGGVAATSDLDVEMNAHEEGTTAQDEAQPQDRGAAEVVSSVDDVFGVDNLVDELGDEDDGPRGEEDEELAGRSSPKGGSSRVKSLLDVARATQAKRARGADSADDVRNGARYAEEAGAQGETTAATGGATSTPRRGGRARLQRGASAARNQPSPPPPPSSPPSSRRSLRTPASSRSAATTAAAAAAKVPKTATPPLRRSARGTRSRRSLRESDVDEDEDGE